LGDLKCAEKRKKAHQGTKSKVGKMLILLSCKIPKSLYFQGLQAFYSKIKKAAEHLSSPATLFGGR
jgi:hypothetical protein